mmetsp:Transcript_136881/g.324329  ORF Transcript_136881/g.324329 Transcript_136881/m.324329 type:complete len:86 (+) Transcript_136881:60-317(+)
MRAFFRSRVCPGTANPIAWSTSIKSSVMGRVLWIVSWDWCNVKTNRECPCDGSPDCQVSRWKLTSGTGTSSGTWGFSIRQRNQRK